MSSQHFNGYIRFESIKCNYKPSIQSINLKGILGEVDIKLGSHYINHGEDWIEVKQIPNYLKTRIKQMDKGLTIGFTKELVLTGVWNQVTIDDNIITLNIGYSHPVIYKLPKNIEIKTYKEGSERHIILFSIDNELVSQVAAEIYNIKKPEPYKGTGFNYKLKKIKLKKNKIK